MYVCTCVCIHLDSLNELMPLGMIMSSVRAIDYLIKRPVWGMRSLFWVVGQGVQEIPKNIDFCCCPWLLLKLKTPHTLVRTRGVTVGSDPEVSSLLRTLSSTPQGAMCAANRGRQSITDVNRPQWPAQQETLKHTYPPISAALAPIKKSFFL